MKRILINATQNEEIRVALCKGNHLYDFDLENRTREQKKSNIYKGHVTRVEPSLEAVFVEYGSQRQGFLPIREISTEYLSGNPRDENIKKLIKEGDELIVQVEKEERGNKGAALSTYVSLAGRYLVLMPNNPRGGGISRQISGKLREDMKRMLGNLDLPKGMSVIIRTAGIGKTQEDLQHDLNHLLNIWQAIQEQNQKYPSPRLVHQEAGVVTRAVRDYLRDDITEIWIDNENAYIEAAGFIDAVMPKQAEKLRKYTDYEPMFSRFNIEKQIETAYQREVRLPSGGSIVIDQTEALVSIDINSAKSTKGSDVAETAFHTNLEAADEIARQLRLRDMGGLIVIDFIDMNDNKNQKEVEKRLIDATKYDRARVQFGEISKFGLMEMSRQRLRPSLEESTGYICPRCHGNGMIRDLRSLSLSIMRQIEQIALKERQGEVQAEVPTDIAAFLLNEKRDALVYLEQDSGTRITILPHAHLESPNFKLHFNRDGFAPSSYERITDTAQEHSDLGYDVDWQTAEKERPEQQPTRQPRQPSAHSSNGDKTDSSNNRQASDSSNSNHQNNNQSNQLTANRTVSHSNEHRNQANRSAADNATQNSQVATTTIQATAAQPQAVAWLSNLFAQAPQAKVANVSGHDAAEAIEALVNTGAQSLGSLGQTDSSALNQNQNSPVDQQNKAQTSDKPTTERQQNRRNQNDDDNEDSKADDRRRRKTRKPRAAKPHQRKDRDESSNDESNESADTNSRQDSSSDSQEKSDNNSRHNERNSDRNRQNSGRDNSDKDSKNNQSTSEADDEQSRSKRKPHSQRKSRGTLERGETLDASTAKSDNAEQSDQSRHKDSDDKGAADSRHNSNPNEVTLQVNEASAQLKSPEVVHLSLDDSKAQPSRKPVANKETVSKKELEQKSEKVTESNSNTTNSEANSNYKHKELATEKEVADTKSVAEQDSKTDSTKNLVSAESSTLIDAEKSEPLATTTADSSNNADDKDETQVKAVDGSNASNSNAETETNGSFELDNSKLFAARYVTANKFGQASNDPRVVRRQQTTATKPKTETENAATKSATNSVATVRGTVGTFIRATLAEADKRLADDGVINCFIAAIAEHTKSTPVVDDADQKQAVADVDNSSDSAAFDFSNYGYESLDAEYLQHFKTMTEATSQIAVEQGKTAVTPRPITQRASNDPRGQHPDYKEIAKEESVEVAVSEEVDVDTVTNVDNDIIANEVSASALSAQVQAEEVTTESEQLLEAEQTLADSDQSLTVDRVATDETAIDEAADSKVETVTDVPAKQSAQAEKSKTTIASYKNMIENVAEQLLPQSGMFNLTTPKVPKARTRKPKTEHKKPTQAEKAEAINDNTDTDANTDSNTSSDNES